MKLLMFASAGGAIGAGLRFLVNEAFAARGLTAPFPWHTVAVNVAGSFLMGVVYVIINERLGSSPEWRTFLATGILGGLTTFSAFSLDVMNLMADGNGLGLRPAVYITASVGLSVAALFAGIWVTRMGLST
jgi:fluoride exporter